MKHKSYNKLYCISHDLGPDLYFYVLFLSIRSLTRVIIVDDSFHTASSQEKLFCSYENISFEKNSDLF